ncbi:MAG: nickel pincer cofactor biosynthesis protein LarB [Gammaproteobacteria bacterium]|nr:nickel pincer cofactor biosynthesis protein LarB [Gammaproteobacteria bacterium]
MLVPEFKPDTERRQRIGIEEAVFCYSKTVSQIESIVIDAKESQRNLFLTRMSKTKYSELEETIQSLIDYEAVAGTGIVGDRPVVEGSYDVAVVTAGTSDLPAAREAERTLQYHGFGTNSFYDVGVAGLWRILNVEQEIRRFSVVIVVAGMDAALASVVGGLIPSVIIAVPTSVGYGVAEGGRSALESVLSSCAPGVATVNIDNGYGAACAAIRVLSAHKNLQL